MSHKILVVEDDLDIGNLIGSLLISDGYEVFRAYSGTEALLLLSQNKFDLIMLDLMLPGLSGEDIVNQVGTSVPIIVVSAKAEPTDKVGLLTDGAADYITKPFDSGELLARVKVQLREKKAAVSGRFEYEDIIVDTEQNISMAGGLELKLTKTEYLILRLLIKSPKRIFSKSQIADLISEGDREIWESSLNVHIHNLRKKLFDASGKTYIEAVWGIGYRLYDEKS